MVKRDPITIIHQIYRNMFVFVWQIISDLKRQLRQQEEEIRYLREALEQERQKNRVSQTNADSR